MSRSVRRTAKRLLPLAAGIFAPALLPGLAKVVGSSALSGLATGAAGLLTGQRPREALVSGLAGGLGHAALSHVAPGLVNSTTSALGQLSSSLLGSAPTISQPELSPAMLGDQSVGYSTLSQPRFLQATAGDAGSQAPSLLGRAAEGLGTMWNRDPVGTTLLGVGALGTLGGSTQQQPQELAIPQVPTSTSSLNQAFDLRSQGREVDIEAILRALALGPAGYRASMFLRNPVTGTNQITGQMTPRTATGTQFFSRGGHVDDYDIGGGQDDRIPAMLSPGEYIIDATTVADLGDGNPYEGAKRLDQFRGAIAASKGRRHLDVIPPMAQHPLEYLRYVN